MLVGELIDLLQGQDENAMVAFATDYGDHGHTQQIHFIEGNIEKVKVDETAYSDSGFSVMDDDSEDEPVGEILILS